MSELLIKVEKTPDRCGLCPCFHAEYPVYCQAVKTMDQKPRITAPYREGRPCWCPLIEVPEPHGRLGDLDKLYSHIKDEQRKYDYPCDGWSECQVALGFVNSAPTVIPASGKEG